MRLEYHTIFFPSDGGGENGYQHEDDVDNKEGKEEISSVVTYSSHHFPRSKNRPPQILPPSKSVICLTLFSYIQLS